MKHLLARSLFVISESSLNADVIILTAGVETMFAEPEATTTTRQLSVLDMRLL